MSSQYAGQVVLAVGGGGRMQPERDSGVLTRLLVWLAQAARIYDTDGMVSVIGFGSTVRDYDTLDLSDSLAVAGFAERPVTDVGTGALMAPAIERALAVENTNGHRLIILVSDCHIDDADATERVIDRAPEGTHLVLLRVATSREGSGLATRLFANRPNCTIVHGTDSLGRVVADVELVFNRLLLPKLQMNTPA